MRGPLDDFDEDEPPTWNIWEYDIETDALRRVISSDIIAEEGQDVAPGYLPDGRILFSSTRQRQSKAILLDENKPQFEAANETRNESAFVLHVMNADGTDIHQITFNPSSDLYASVLQNGRVLFTRWDTGGGNDGLHLYTSNPDGTDTQLHYGALSHATGTNGTTNDTNIEFMRAREMSNGRLMVLVRERTDVDFGGNLTIIDANTYVENTQPLAANAGMPGPAQTPATLNDVRTVPGPLARRPLRVGLPAVGRHEPHSRELVAVPRARCDRTRSDPHHSLRRAECRRSGHGHRAADLQRVDVQSRRRTPSCRSSRRSKASWSPRPSPRSRAIRCPR